MCVRSIFVCVLLQDFHDEHAWQAFRRRDKGNTGYITAKDFEEIMLNLKSYLLTPFTRDNLVTVGAFIVQQ
jgi:Ca2+-binding EF-hand superfamily protein